MYMNTDVEKRKFGFRDRCSRLVELNETVTLPYKSSIIYIPEEESFTTDITSFEGTYFLLSGGKKLQLSETISLGKRIYEPDEWDEYRKAVVSQKSFAQEPVILKINR